MYRCLVFLLAVAVVTGRLTNEFTALKVKQSVAEERHFPKPQSTIGDALHYYHQTGTIELTGRDYSAYVAVLDDPRYFSFKPPKDGCVGPNVFTSKSAEAHDCVYATNAGFFDTREPDNKNKNHCMGELISNGKVMNSAEHTKNKAMFGLTKNSTYVAGYLTLKHINSLHFAQLINGEGLLVHNGQPFIESATDLDVDSNFVNEKAPRNAIGIFNNGTMAIVEVDGIEYERIGLDLWEFSQLLVTMGFHEAVNLDGGGSAVSWAKGKVISRPTCVDTPRICERAVTSITCIKKKPQFRYQ